MKLRIAVILSLILCLAVPRVSRAQDTQTQPVAVISLVWGAVTLKHQDADYRPARWLDAIYPGDFVRTTGPGSKLLITYFFDNHQEVLGSDAEARVDPTTLTSQSGGAIRKDPARNPFSTGGVQNPFVYVHRLVTDDFKGAGAPPALAREAAWLKASVRSYDPVTFAWAASPGVKSYQVQVLDANNALVLGLTSKAVRSKLSGRQANKLFSGTVYSWKVTTPGNATVLPGYDFMYLSRPQWKWYSETAGAFQKLRQRKQLQRSDYTDYLLMSAQLVRVDDVMSLCQEIAGMDGRNPAAFRALTRAYLSKGCPAHAKQAYQTEILLGGVDPIYP